MIDGSQGGLFVQTEHIGSASSLKSSFPLGFRLDVHVLLLVEMDRGFLG